MATAKTNEIIEAIKSNVAEFEINDIILAAKKMASDHAVEALKKLGGEWDLANELTDERLEVCAYDPCEGADSYANAVVRRAEFAKGAEYGEDTILLYCTLCEEGIETEYTIDKLEPGDIESLAKWLDDEYEYYEGELEECFVEAVRQGTIRDYCAEDELEENFDNILAFRFDDCEYGPMSREFALGILKGFLKS